MVPPNQVIIPDDCFNFLSFQGELVYEVLTASIERTFGASTLRNENLGNYVENEVPSLKMFMTDSSGNRGHGIPSLSALSNAMRSLQRSHDFHENLVLAIPTVPGPPPKLLTEVTALEDFRAKAFSLLSIAGMSGFCQVAVPLGMHDNLPVSVSFITNHGADGFLLNFVQSLYGPLIDEENRVLAIPTVPGPPPKLQTEVTALEDFRAKAFSLLSIAGMSGFCQVAVPLGMHDNLPVSVSFIANHGADGFLLNFVQSLYGPLIDKVNSCWKTV